MTRRSYSRLSRLPAWYLLDEDKKLIATVRAEDASTAARLFREARLVGRARYVRGPVWPRSRDPLQHR